MSGCEAVAVSRRGARLVGQVYSSKPVPLISSARATPGLVHQTVDLGYVHAYIYQAHMQGFQKGVRIGG